MRTSTSASPPRSGISPQQLDSAPTELHLERSGAIHPAADTLSAVERIGGERIQRYIGALIAWGLGALFVSLVRLHKNLGHRIQLWGPLMPTVYIHGGKGVVTDRQQIEWVYGRDLGRWLNRKKIVSGITLDQAIDFFFRTGHPISVVIVGDQDAGLQYLDTLLQKKMVELPDVVMQVSGNVFWRNNQTGAIERHRRTVVQVFNRPRPHWRRS